MLRLLILSIFLLPWQMMLAVPSAQAVDRNAIIIGDSQAQGLRRPLTAALEGYDVTVVEASAQPGKGLKYFLDNDVISGLVTSRHPELVILIIGGNDNVRANGRTEGIPRETYEERLRTAYAEAAGTGRTVVWIGPATSQDAAVQTRHEATRTVQQAILPGLGARWIDGMTGSEDGPYGSDPSHLTGEGYRRWACLLAPEISAGGPATSCPTTADPDQTFIADVADPEAAPGSTGGGESTACDANSAGVLPVHLGVSIGGLTEVMGLGDYINTFYRYLAGISLIVAIVMVVYGGFRYLIGATTGDIARGKEIIRDALIGMVLVLSAYAILNTINPATVNLNSIVLTSIQCLEIPAAAIANRCTDDASCGGGNHCVEVTTVWNDVSDAALDGLSEGAVGGVEGAAVGFVAGPGAIPGALLGGGAGFLYGFFSNISSPVMQCTDGALGSPCGEDAHCTSGGICAQGFHVCIAPSGNPVGSPCNENANCDSSTCEGSEGYLQCHGDVPILTQEMLQANGYHVPDEAVCFINGDCEAGGARCEGPAGSPKKFCIRREGDTPLGAPCFLNAFGVPLPVTCAGAGGSTYACLACPSSGSRNWVRLNSTTDPNHTRLGSCRPADDVGDPCAGSTH